MGAVRAGARVLLVAAALLGAGGAWAQEYVSGGVYAPRVGPYALLGGGIEDYTGALGDALSLGPEAGIHLGLQASPLLGLELAYTGAFHEVDTGVEGGLRDGTDVIRHGGQAIVTLGIPLRFVRPYALGGIGFSFTDVRLENSVYLDDSDGYVPVGVGAQVGNGPVFFDARFTYHVIFEEGFILEGDDGGGRYQAQASVGVSF